MRVLFNKYCVWLTIVPMQYINEEEAEKEFFLNFGWFMISFFFHRLSNNMSFCVFYWFFSFFISLFLYFFSLYISLFDLHSLSSCFLSFSPSPRCLFSLSLRLYPQSLMYLCSMSCDFFLSSITDANLNFRTSIYSST